MNAAKSLTEQITFAGLRQQADAWKSQALPRCENLS
jgi:hypothetical protein